MTKRKLMGDGFTHLWTYYFGGVEFQRPLRITDYPENPNVGGSAMMGMIEMEARENDYRTTNVLDLSEAWWME